MQRYAAADLPPEKEAPVSIGWTADHVRTLWSREKSLAPGVRNLGHAARRFSDWAIPANTHTHAKNVRIWVFWKGRIQAYFKANCYESVTSWFSSVPRSKVQDSIGIRRQPQLPTICPVHSWHRTLYWQPCYVNKLFVYYRFLSGLWPSSDTCVLFWGVVR
jgi:hypothetical protein